MNELYASESTIRPYVFAEPDAYIPALAKTHCAVFKNMQKKGHLWNWLDGLSYMVHTHTNEQFFIVCEDDIQWTVESYTKLLDAVDLIDADVYSPYCSLINGKLDVEPGWHVPTIVKHHGYGGALCLCFSRLAATRLLESKEFFMGVAKDKHLDKAIGETIMTHLKLRLVNHMPTLIYHLGTESSLWDIDHSREYRARQPYSSIMQTSVRQ